LGFALLNYHEQSGYYPPAIVKDSNGTPIQGWRGVLAPWIEEVGFVPEHLCLDEPWNSRANSPFALTVIPAMICPDEEETRPYTYPQTSYVAVVGEGTAWPGDRPLRIDEIKDDRATTIVLVEIASSGMIILEPRDLELDQLPLQINPPAGKGISSHHSGGAHVLMADGSVRFLPDDLPAEVLRAMLTINGGEEIDLERLQLD